MPLLGAHMSIAGGYYKAVERAAEAGCDVVQVFTKNNNQWRAKEIADEEARLFKRTLRKLRIEHPIAHDSYLINLASPDRALWKKSVESFVLELRRAELLGLRWVVTHPGAYTTSTEKEGLRRVIRALDEADRQTRELKVGCLLETTAGQGSSLGWRFEQLAAILDGVKSPGRLGVCLDTCHVFAAGYPLILERDYRATMREFNKVIGTGRIKAFHLNDSKAEFGSRVDRHAKIGAGKLGLAPFRWLLNDRRFRNKPMYLETPKGQENGEDLDRINLRTLRGLIEEN